jgi:hypothetical protein
MNVRTKITTVAMAVLACAPFAASAAESATYEVTVTPLWTPDRFPVEYPKAGLLTGPHFSGVIGATHDGSFTLYKVGNLPTPGLERLSEMGKHDPLDAEIKAAIARGVVGSLFESDPNKDLTKATQKFTVTVDAVHPIVSMVEMIAPSPDWFAGVADVNLMEGGAFAAEKTVDALAYDSGGDDGTTYTADDVDTNPKKPTSAASAKHFAKNGNAMPVARITFKRK